MAELAIRVDRLSKQYRIGAPAERYRTLRESIYAAAAAPFRRLRHGRNGRERSTIWALRDVSLEIRRGEAVGLIGPNGAGKSTLLKVLSRITEPAEGYAEIRGRVGSLLEVGTGFHPELTGRENVYLNGAILGMRRREIDGKFDEIVSFAEVERFVDTPVKHFSSGMYLRLAFAVAAYLDTDILLVDEVLAVGDAAFQKKCLGTLDSAGHQGRTVILVSHNLAAIHALCGRAIVLAEGRVVHDGGVGEGVAMYTGLSGSGGGADSAGAPAGAIRMCGPLDRRWYAGRPLTAEWLAPMPGGATSATLWCLLDDASGAHLVRQQRRVTVSEPAQTWRISVTLPPLWLPSGNYSLQLRVYPNTVGQRARCFSDPCLFEVQAAVAAPSAVLSPDLRWEVAPANA